MKFRFLFFTLCGLVSLSITTSTYAQEVGFMESDDLVIEPVETTDPPAPQPAETEVIFPDFQESAAPLDEQFMSESPEFIPDDTLLMDTLPDIDDFPDFDGGFEIPDFGSELDPARAIRQRIQLRRARMKVEAQPEMQALRVEAEATRTPYEYREKMQEYYTRLFTQVAAAKPGVADLAEEEKERFLRTVTPRGIRPTERPAHLPPLPPGRTVVIEEIEEVIEVTD